MLGIVGKMCQFCCGSSLDRVFTLCLNSLFTFKKEQKGVYIVQTVMNVLIRCLHLAYIILKKLKWWLFIPCPPSSNSFVIWFFIVCAVFNFDDLTTLGLSEWLSFRMVKHIGFGAKCKSQFFFVVAGKIVFQKEKFVWACIVLIDQTYISLIFGGWYVNELLFRVSVLEN